MQNKKPITTLSDNFLAFQMFRLRKKIEEINESNRGFNDYYIDEIASHRKVLLNQFYKEQYGDNVCCLD
ncbi:MAG: hypothetical protein DRQ88_12040 [Epsilonproteobacteria bacterium]|nr:MAG: hypothetical protein DRQ88_12040 [Campylobacterota bacterium]